MKPGTFPLAIFGSLLVFAGPGRADEVVIEVFRAIFLPEAITINVGDTVRWQWIAGEHTITSGRPDGKSGTPDEPGVMFDVTLDEENPVFEFTFETFRERGFFFFDRGIPDQLGVIEVSSGVQVFRVAVVDNVFRPERSFIFAGDSILWEHEPMEDDHTVTSGLSSDPKHNPGALFDQESTDARPIFVYQFVEPGEYPYFCIPHEDMGMTGSVHVQKTFVRGDVTGDGGLNITDPIALLAMLFLGDEPSTCADALDGNDDGRLNIADPTSILEFLFKGGRDMPPPHPIPGGDRTEDLLLCD